MLDIFYPKEFQSHNRSSEEWAIHHWLNAKERVNPKHSIYKFYTSNIYSRALNFGLRPEFAWELANM